MPFKKGRSGNPGGRPKVAEEIRALARAACPKAIETLIAQLDHPDPKVVANAASLLLDRGMGKPMQAHEISGGDGSAMELEEQRNIDIKAWMDETAREIGLVQWERGAGRDGPLETGSFSPEERTRDRRTRTASIAAS